MRAVLVVPLTDAGAARTDSPPPHPAPFASVLPDSIPAEQHVASILSKLGFIVNLQQVYLVGVRPEQGVRDLVERVPDPTGALAEHFVDQVMPKIELCVETFPALSLACASLTREDMP